MRIPKSSLISLTLAVLALSLFLTQLAQAASWVTTGSPNVMRWQYHTATLLPNGKVLVAGGAGSDTSAELYDLASGTWTTTGSPKNARIYHTATLLPNGKVLVVGGADAGILATAELYDPATGAWTLTGPLNTARYIHRATLLANGKVLVTGGQGTTGSALASSELYWAVLGSATEVSPGQYQFADAQAASNAQCFYRVCSP
jgi:WD40 repeat protein